MENNENNNKDYFVVDVVYLLSALWQKLWVLIISSVLVAAMFFAYSSYMINPKYNASVMLYVNNSSFSVGNTNFSISSSEITAAQSLVKTYIVVLNNRTTLEKVIKATGVNYSYKTLSNMITASAVNDTEVFKVTVTSTDPYEAAKIANGIAEVLPDRVSDIIEGASMRLVDKAVENTSKVYPNITNNTLAGFAVGLILSAAVVIIFALRDDTIRDEDYITSNYNFPILARIPDMHIELGGKYGKYSRYGKYGKYGYGKYGKYKYYSSYGKDANGKDTKSDTAEEKRG